MKNRKGFTIVELLAVIVIISLLITLVSPVLLNSSDVAKEKSYQTKKKMIETAAVMYAQDNYMLVIKEESNSVCEKGYEKVDENEVKCKLTVQNLLDNDYLEADKIDESKSCVENPKDNTCLDDKTITITVNLTNKKITADLKETTTE